MRLLLEVLEPEGEIFNDPMEDDDLLNNQPINDPDA